MQAPEGKRKARGRPWLLMTAWELPDSDLASASAGNRARVTSMATMYSTTRPLMLVEILRFGDSGVENPASLNPVVKK